MEQISVSVIIPCYNGSQFLKQTLDSIIVQKDVTFEIIIVDDGSTDNPLSIIESFSDKKIQYTFQKNKGVSAARNNGLLKAKGTYIVFFDADDIMPDNLFLKSRVDILSNNNTIDFVCGEVKKINGTAIFPNYYRGTSELLHEEVLLYNKEVITCPSNYCFRKLFLKTHQLVFNTKLSSTADRFFLLQCAQVGKSLFSKSVSPLHYRVSPNSMSYHLNDTLVLDNQLFYHELIIHTLIPDKLKNKSLFLGNYILFASYWKINKKSKSLVYGLKSFSLNPLRFIQKCVI